MGSIARRAHTSEPVLYRRWANKDELVLAATGRSPAQIREQAMGDQLLPLTRTIYQQAAARGEIDPERIPPAVLALPFDLVRHDLVMDLKPLNAERIHSIVDEMFLPLVRAHHTN